MTFMPSPSSRHFVARPTEPRPTRPEPLIGDRAVLVDVLGADIVVGAQHVPVDGHEQRDGQLGHRIGVAPRRPQHGDALRRGAVDVDVGRIAAC
jgi:hypothetical protein